MQCDGSPRLDHSIRFKKDALSGFLRRVASTDILVIIWAVLGAELIRFGPDAVEATLPGSAVTSANLKYTAFTVVLIVAWVLMLRLHGAYGRRLLGHGPE